MPRCHSEGLAQRGLKNPHAHAARWILRLAQNDHARCHSEGVAQRGLKNPHAHAARWILRLAQNDHARCHSEGVAQRGLKNPHAHAARWILRLAQNDTALLLGAHSPRCRLQKTFPNALSHSQVVRPCGRLHSIFSMHIQSSSVCWYLPSKLVLRPQRVAAGRRLQDAVWPQELQCI